MSFKTKNFDFAATILRLRVTLLQAPSLVQKRKGIFSGWGQRLSSNDVR